MTTASQFHDLIRNDLAQWVPGVVATATAEAQAAVSQAGAKDALALLQGHAGTVAQVLAQAISERIAAPSARDADPAPSPQTYGADAAASDEDTGPLGLLSLIPDQQIDDDIETAGIIDAIAAQAERELRRLAALYGALQGLPVVDSDSLPMTPATCARALHAILDPFGLSPVARRALHRFMGKALALHMREVYRAQCDMLHMLGVQSSPRQSRSAAFVAYGHGLRHREDPEASTRLDDDASLDRLVSWSRNATQAARPARAPAGAAVQLLSEPVESSSGTSSRTMDRGSALLAMNALFEQLVNQAWLSPESRELLKTLRHPARTIAVNDPNLWNALDHPWWQLIDRFVAHGAVHHANADREADLVTRSMGRIVERVANAKVVDRGVCQAAVNAVDRLSREGLLLRADRLLGDVSVLEQAARRESLESELGHYVNQQLRANPISRDLAKILIGPLVKSMAAVALTSSRGDSALSDLAQLVDDLINAAGQVKHPVPTAHRLELCQRARQALAAGGRTGDPLDADVATLEAVLRAPVVPDEPWVTEADPPTSTATAQGRAALPTVPVDIVTTIDPTTATLDRRTWIESLAPGDYCHAFLRQRWVSTQLIWHSEGRTLFVFSSRDGAPQYTMTRRGLEKLRNAGLATSIVGGQLLAQAMNTVVDSGNDG